MKKRLYFSLDKGVYSIKHKKIYDYNRIKCPVCGSVFDKKIKGNDQHCGKTCKPTYTIVKIIN